MPNIFIFHGRHGAIKPIWFPWLKGELEEIGCTVFFPRFPVGEELTLQNWMGVFKQFEKYVDEDTVFVGHSVGATFTLRLLENLNKKIKAAFLVSCFVTGAPSVSGLSSFYEKEFDWDKIRKNCEYFYQIHSDNDPYVSLDMAEKVSKPLGITLTVIEGGGHFNEKSGYDTQFPQLLDMIEDVLTDL
ncbi:MAG: alpha/beta hydrolase [Candidatus Micrarchaeales archaeon]|nr:alpha/beta hydrolase [Candidatus Micrarchaeales archaeon]